MPDPKRILLMNKIDEACDEFEAQWQSGRRPSLEEYLSGWEQADQTTLLRHLIDLDSHYAASHGEDRSVEYYRQRFPQHVPWIDQHFNSSAGTSMETGSGETLPGQGGSPARQGHADSGAALNLLRPAEESDEIGRLGGYRVLELLGVGGMGVVFRAEDPQLGRLVALKAIKPELSASQAARGRFLREARATAAIEHDNIVTIHQVGEDRQTPYLAMQLLRGLSLATHLNNLGRLEQREAVRIGMEIAHGLAAAHDQGLIHRDIKPDNIWLEGERRRVKILDFGLARLDADDSDLTHTGMVVGTPKYMAPEQAEGSPVDHRCDLFSLGAVIYHMAIGKPPFRGQTLIATLNAVSRAEYPRASESRPDIDAELEKLLTELLSKEISNRPGTAAEVAERLAVILARLNAPNVQPPQQDDQGEHAGKPETKPIQLSQGGGRGWRGWLIAGGAALAFILAAIIFYVQTNQGTIRVQINDPSIEVKLKGTEITLLEADNGKNIRLGVGEHTLIVSRGDFEFETDKLILKRGDKESVRVELLSETIEVRKGQLLIGKKTMPAPKLASAEKASTEPAGNQPAPTPHQPSVIAASKADREVAQWLKSSQLKGFAEIRVGNENRRIFFHDTDFPNEPFTFLAITLADNEAMGDAELLRLSNLPTLAYLGLANTSITDRGLQHLRGLPKLSELNIQKTNISDEGLTHLGNLTELHTIFMSNTQVTDKGFAEFAELAIAKMLRLRHLELGSTHTTNESLVAVAKIKSLRDLWIGPADQITDDGIGAFADSQLVGLNLTHLPNVTERSLTHVAAMKNLERFVLSNVPIAVNEFAVLSKHPSLVWINLNGIHPEPWPAEREQVAELVKQLPRIRLLSTSFGVYERTVDGMKFRPKP